MAGLFVLFIGITLCSKLLVSIFAAEEFFDAWRYIPILTLGAMFSCISGFAGSNFSATRESKYFFYSSVWGAVSAIVLNFVLIPPLGIWGVALSIVISFVIMSYARVAYGWKYVRITSLWTYIVLLGFCVLLIITMNSIESLYINIGIAIVMLLVAWFMNRDLLGMIKNKLITHNQK